MTSNIKKLVFRWYHTLILTEDNEVFGFGISTEGQLASTSNVLVPTKLFENVTAIGTGYQYSVIVEYNSEGYTFGDNTGDKLGLDSSQYFYENPLFGLNFVFSPGNRHTMVLDKDSGEIYGYGYNAAKEIDWTGPSSITQPVKTNFYNVTDVVASVQRTMILLSNNHLYCVGINSVCQKIYHL